MIFLKWQTSSAQSDLFPVLVSGDPDLIAKLSPGIVHGLPTEAIEWKRSFGRVSKTVSLEAKLVKLGRDPDRLRTDPRKLRDVPVLHTFWIECPVQDYFKYSYLQG